MQLIKAENVPVQVATEEVPQNLSGKEMVRPTSLNMFYCFFGVLYFCCIMYIYYSLQHFLFNL